MPKIIGVGSINDAHFSPQYGEMEAPKLSLLGGTRRERTSGLLGALRPKPETRAHLSSVRVRAPSNTIAQLKQRHIESARRLAPLANYQVHDSVPPEIQAIVAPVMYALGGELPPRFNRIDIHAAPPLPGEAFAASTECFPETKSVKIEFVVSEPAEQSPTSLNPVERAERQGRAAQSLTHEIALHAHPFFHTLKESPQGHWHEPDKDHDHRAIYFPPSSNNSFLKTVRRVLPYLPDIEIKRAFLKEYARDVENHIMTDCSDEQFVQTALEWHSTLEAAAEHPTHPLWQADK